MIISRVLLSCAALLASSCTADSAPTAVAVPSPSGAYGIVMLAQLAPGTVVNGDVWQTISQMRGVDGAGGTQTTLRVVVRARATIGDYLAAREAMVKVPGVTSIATSTSLGVALDGRVR